MKNIILIGGAPTTGKTTIAQQLSTKLTIPWISTDQIRSMLKSATDENRWPALFQTINDKDRIEKILDQEIDRAEVIWKGVLALIENHYPWESFIIEGMAILPQFVERDFSHKPFIRAAFLIHSDVTKIKEIILERSKLPFIKTKTNTQQESKVKQIQLFNQKIQTDALKYGFPTIEAQTDKTLMNVMETLVLT